MIPYRYRPSPGFILVCLVYSLTAVFFLWGSRRPDLDRVWFLQHELRTGVRTGLDGGERNLLINAMAKHPALCNALCDGGMSILSSHTDGFLETLTAYVARAPGPGQGSLELSLSPLEPGSLERLEVRGFGVDGPLAPVRMTRDRGGRFRIPLEAAHHPQLWEIRWRPVSDGEEAPPAIRLTFAEDR